MSVPLDSVHTISVSVHPSAQALHLQRIPYHLVVFDSRHLWRSWSPRESALADLQTRRIPSTHPTQPVSLGFAMCSAIAEHAAWDGDPPRSL